MTLTPEALDDLLAEDQALCQELEELGGAVVPSGQVAVLAFERERINWLKGDIQKAKAQAEEKTAWARRRAAIAERDATILRLRKEVREVAAAPVVLPSA
jgi:hypothetical protein